jgi:hypothetical protein
MIIEESKDRYIRVLEYKNLKMSMMMDVSFILSYQVDAS